MFWGPGPEKCEKAQKGCIFAPKHTFHPEVAFLRKSTFRSQKSILGDSGGISPNLSKEFLLFRVFPGFGRFRDAKIIFYENASVFTWFSWKNDFSWFYNFSRRVMENTLGFCHPSNAFRGTLIPNQSSTQKINIPRKMVILLKMEHFRWNFTKMNVFNDFSTFRGPWPKPYIFIVLFGAFWGPAGAEMVIFTKFHPFWWEINFLPPSW